MLISPAERPVEFWAKLGKTSSVPEQLGVDFLTFSPVFGRVGVQRKEIGDLVASLSDGRVAREIIDMRELDVGIWLIEGRPQWSTEGHLLSSRTEFTLTSLQGILFSLMSNGFWVLRTDSIQDSMSYLSALDRWMAKPVHHGINGRPAPRTMLGPPTDKDWQIHFWQGLPGMGYTRAKKVVEHYGGLPVVLKDGVRLEDVDGIGKVIAKKVERVLGGKGANHD